MSSAVMTRRLGRRAACARATAGATYVGPGVRCVVRSPVPPEHPDASKAKVAIPAVATVTLRDVLT